MDKGVLRCVLPGGGQDPLHLCNLRCQILQDDAGDLPVGAVQDEDIAKKCQEVKLFSRNIIYVEFVLKLCASGKLFDKR